MMESVAASYLERIDQLHAQALARIEEARTAQAALLAQDAVSRPRRFSSWPCGQWHCDASMASLSDVDSPCGL